MPEQAALECLAFAARGKALSGVRPVAEFSRLAAELAATGGDLAYRVTPVTHASGRPALRVVVSAGVQLVCQRCLGGIAHQLASESEVVLVRSADELEALDRESGEPVDGVVAGADCEVMALVEDEALLALPMSAIHADGQCAIPADDAVDENAHPFATLAALKRQHDE